jgi:DNA-binding response OmpR family regulator
VKIGNYIFNPAQQWLELDGEKTVLTVKEARLLAIFATALNTIIERDSIQKEVWENEGVIVTRSLDVFISKLRKKLAGDPAIKIVNVHGKGYRLEVV